MQPLMSPYMIVSDRRPTFCVEITTPRKAVGSRATCMPLLFLLHLSGMTSSSSLGFTDGGRVGNGCLHEEPYIMCPA
jgi:hypothetical protein